MANAWVKKLRELEIFECTLSGAEAEESASILCKQIPKSPKHLLWLHNEMNAPPKLLHPEDVCERLVKVSVKIHRVLLEASSVGWVNGSIPNGHSNSNPSSNPKEGDRVEVLRGKTGKPG